ncbi:hypothetical protein FACS189454_00150 [Planctomycetales bacterium]|nr:hypothetical protein FACS189454_00150 [Planctomycetales bacterium]
MMTTRTFFLLTIALPFVFFTAYGAENGVVIDQNTPVDVLRTEAERNNPVAQCVLGERYYNGAGIAQDKVEAVIWFRKAAEQGFAPAKKDSESAQKPRMAGVKDEFSMVLIYITGICIFLIPFLIILVLLIQNNKLKNASLTILHRIALYQRRINLGILLMFFGIGLIAALVMGTWLCHLSEQQRIVIVRQVGAILFCVYIYYLIWMLSAIYSLADSLNIFGCLILILWIPLAFTFPFINLLILLWMSRKANKTLTAAGYKVGFLGADMRQFQSTEMYQPEQTELPQ